MKTLQLAALKKSLVYPVRTTVATVLALVAAKALGLPEVYWAPISTLIVITQSDLSAALKISWQRLVGTALGSVAGALLVAKFGPVLSAYTAGVLGLGLLCAALRLDRAAYRFAGITLTVIMLIARAEGAWAAALHRFIEVSIGIAVGVIVTALWPDQPTGKK
jgi:uncharacterized membrane protein YccC